MDVMYRKSIISLYKDKKPTIINTQKMQVKVANNCFLSIIEIHHQWKARRSKPEPQFCFFKHAVFYIDDESR